MEKPLPRSPPVYFQVGFAQLLQYLQDSFSLLNLQKEERASNSVKQGETLVNRNEEQATLETAGHWSNRKKKQKSRGQSVLERPGAKTRGKWRVETKALFSSRAKLFSVKDQVLPVHPACSCLGWLLWAGSSQYNQCTDLKAGRELPRGSPSQQCTGLPLAPFPCRAAPKPALSRSPPARLGKQLRFPEPSRLLLSEQSLNRHGHPSRVWRRAINSITAVYPLTACWHPPYHELALE